ncbi:hypothetical protein AC249_AIPGENE2928 [Exaiptasia diaphana]|nr:hypothetical protein AC249_AIPGENE2928 [Exaiptasia diaphana]
MRITMAACAAAPHNQPCDSFQWFDDLTTLSLAERPEFEKIKSVTDLSKRLNQFLKAAVEGAQKAAAAAAQQEVVPDLPPLDGDKALWRQTIIDWKLGCIGRPKLRFYYDTLDTVRIARDPIDINVLDQPAPPFIIYPRFYVDPTWVDPHAETESEPED